LFHVWRRKEDLQAREEEFREEKDERLKLKVFQDWRKMG